MKTKTKFLGEDINPAAILRGEIEANDGDAFIWSGNGGSGAGITCGFVAYVYSPNARPELTTAWKDFLHLTTGTKQTCLDSVNKYIEIANGGFDKVANPVPTSHSLGK